MGLVMKLEDEKLRFEIGYFSFSELRQEITDVFENTYIKGLSGDELDGFLNHSDCSGVIAHKEARKYHSVLKKLKVKHSRFEELKFILKVSSDKKMDIIFC
ncbi:MAG: hypothetical protein ACRCTZ_16135 [Sarcina sp.]